MSHQDSRPLADPPAPAPTSALPLHEDEATLEAIARFDELEDDRLAELESNPATSQILRRLQEVDRWLESALAENQGRDATVTAEELYRFGRGRGSEPLSDLRRREVAAYLEEHPEEARWTEGLDGPIPSPLDVTSSPEPRQAAEPKHAAERRGPVELRPVHLPGPRPAAEDVVPVEQLRETPGPHAAGPSLVGPSSVGPRSVASHTHHHQAPRPIAPWMRWIPVAAAALVMAMVLDRPGPTHAMDGGLPESPVLRSASSTALLFPRGRVIAPMDGVVTYAERPLFEVAAVEGADRYRFELRRNDGTAFDEGDMVWAAESTSRNATADRLTAGTYEWGAWATVDGVERDLGRLSFVVLPASDSGLVACASGANAGAAREDVRRLHSAGFLTDARERARALPPGEARTAYLADHR